MDGTKCGERENKYFVCVLVKHGGIEIPLFSKGMESKEQAEKVKKILYWCLNDKVEIKSLLDS